ncbi:hypothetical protein HanIR_Chr08g0373661 [Helianthus annuus]|nr:hypothetical protein HanIR_Chr08g0373661 [Helianthus annuus]
MRKLPIVVLEHSTSLVPSVYIMSLITQSHYPFHSHKIQHMQGVQMLLKLTGLPKAEASMLVWLV